VPFLTYFLPSATPVGIAINPITRRAILADPNATSSQIEFIDPQSESVNFVTLLGGATGSGTGPPELGAAAVAFQPFSNTAVSFNPTSQFNQVSLIDPSALQRLAIIPTGQTGKATASFTPAGANSTTITVNLPGALAVGSINNVALAVNSGSDNITYFKLGTIKALHIESVLTPAIDAGNASITTKASISPAVKITLGAPPASVGPVQIFGSGFTSASKVRLDTIDVTTLGATVAQNGSQELDVTFPPGVFTAPRHFALDVANSASVTSNVVDFTVLEEIPLTACNGTAAAPGGVAIDEVNNLAVFTETGCNNVSVIDVNPTITVGNQVQPNPNLGHILGSIPTGGSPTAVAVLPSLAYTKGQTKITTGVAVVTNNSANTVSVLDLVNLTPVNDASGNPIAPAVGTHPSGLAIDQETNLAVIANTDSTDVSAIDLTPLTATPIGALTPIRVPVDPNPIAVAIDPDRGTNGRGLAVVTCQILNGASSPFGELVAVDIGAAPPMRSTSGSTSFLTPTPTGVVFDPSVSPALFYAVSTQGNVITAFNPDNGGSAQTIKVGINPNAIAYNFQTGTILTVNSLSNTISIVDSQTFATKATLGIGGTSKFAAAIQTLTNLAVIADQANNRVILFPLPK